VVIVCSAPACSPTCHARVRAQYLTHVRNGSADVNNHLKKGKIGKEMIAGEDAVVAVENMVAAVVASVAAGNIPLLRQHLQPCRVAAAQIGTNEDAVTAETIQGNPPNEHVPLYFRHRDCVLHLPDRLRVTHVYLRSI